MLAIIGYAIIIVMMFLILKDKALPATCFVFLPIIGAVIAGFSITDISGFVSKGVGTTWATAILFVFSILYFGIMNYAGLFDKLVDYLLKVAGNNVTMILLATAIIAIIGHIDGATTSTYLITIPVMLPIFKKMKLRPTVLLLIVSSATGVMNLVPWGGPTIRAATAIGQDATQLWVSMIPMQVFGIVCTLSLAVYFSFVEKKRLAKAGEAGIVVDLSKDSGRIEETDLSMKRPKLLWFNLLLTIIIIVLLVKNIFPAYAVFMFGMLIAIAVNYPDLKMQQTIIHDLAGGSIGLVVTLIGAGVFLGIFVNTGMIDAMSQVLIHLLPGSLQKYLHLIIGALGAPMGMIMGPDPYYYGVLPLISETVARFGVTPDQVAHAMLIGENVALAVSPCVPTTFLAMGLAGVELKDHIKFSFKWLWGISILMLVFAVLFNII
ncbi:citrate:proton symporter [Clostridium sp. chh4-2]|uniref:CitMHS family transporter n=1 Tax=Clostridium sp. chh4-2 TaxID=2067550 RepID=UPI000CCFAC7E|nr:citrate:proton symporter [Clostridium sp. chh4-2]PNV63995.1 citrate:proton symporter [Clostridium sp. chh4-2]